MCCAFADDEALEHEAESFDCGSCPVQAHLAGLDVDNQHAWDLAHTLLTRMVGDTHSFGPLLVRLTGEMDEEVFADLVQRLTLIYDVLVPAPRRRSE